MFIAEIRIAEEVEMSQLMARMREWLDQNRFEARVFRYRFQHPGVVVQAEFSTEGAASSFARAFGGGVVPTATATPGASTAASAATSELVDAGGPPSQPSSRARPRG
jgi:hypothetical protein